MHYGREARASERACVHHTFIWGPRRFCWGIAHPHTPTHTQDNHHTKIFIYSMISTWATTKSTFHQQALPSILTPTQPLRKIKVNYINTKCVKSGHTIHEQRLLSKDLSFLCTKWSNVRQQLLFGTNPHCNYRHENWLLTFIRITILVIRDSS